jgi:putative peptide zinc metalloprotease protein
MRLLRARLLALLVAAIAALFAASPALAQDATATAEPEPVQIDNGAIAVNTEDDSTVYDFAFDFTRVVNGIVDQTNAAIAYATCTNCTTVAIAVQIVLVMGDATQVTPENLALALNENCEACTTVAGAYQFVFGNGDRIRLTGQAQSQLRELVRQFKAIGEMDGTEDEINDEFERLVGELRKVLDDGIVTVGKPEPAEDEPAAEADAAPEPTPEPATTPEATATPEPAAEPTPEATATPESTATPEPQG